MVREEDLISLTPDQRRKARDFAALTGNSEIDVSSKAIRLGFDQKKEGLKSPEPVPIYKNLSAEHQTAIHNLANGYGERDPQQFIDDMYRFGTQELIEEIVND